MMMMMMTMIIQQNHNKIPQIANEILLYCLYCLANNHHRTNQDCGFFMMTKKVH